MLIPDNMNHDCMWENSVFNLEIQKYWFFSRVLLRERLNDLKVIKCLQITCPFIGEGIQAKISQDICFFEKRS